MDERTNERIWINLCAGFAHFAGWGWSDRDPHQPFGLPGTFAPVDRFVTTTGCCVANAWALAYAYPRLEWDEVTWAWLMVADGDRHKVPDAILRAGAGHQITRIEGPGVYILQSHTHQWFVRVTASEVWQLEVARSSNGLSLRKRPNPTERVRHFNERLAEPLGFLARLPATANQTGYLVGARINHPLTRV